MKTNTNGRKSIYAHLSVDVGGSGIKVIVLDTTGNPQTERTRVETPQPATPGSDQRDRSVSSPTR